MWFVEPNGMETCPGLLWGAISGRAQREPQFDAYWDPSYLDSAVKLLVPGLKRAVVSHLVPPAFPVFLLGGRPSWAPP